MTTGKQLAGLLLLSTALTYPGAAFAQDAVDDRAAARRSAAEPPRPRTQAPKQPAEEEFADEQDISVPGGDVIFVTGRINRDPTRGSTQVLSVLSTEEIARTGEGNIAGALAASPASAWSARASSTSAASATAIRWRCSTARRCRAPSRCAASSRSTCSRPA